MVLLIILYQCSNAFSSTKRHMCHWEVYRVCQHWHFTKEHITSKLVKTSFVFPPCSFLGMLYRQCDKLPLCRILRILLAAKARIFLGKGTVIRQSQRFRGGDNLTFQKNNIRSCEFLHRTHLFKLPNKRHLALLFT